MEIRIQTEPTKTGFGNIPAGKYFWREGSLYLKPEIKGCIKELKDRRLAVSLTDNILTAFSDNDVPVVPELNELVISYVIEESK